MNKLEKYAVKRIICLNEKMDYINAQIQQEYKKPDTVIDFNVIKDMNNEYNDLMSEAHEIGRCLLDQPTQGADGDDIPNLILKMDCEVIEQ